MTSSTTLNGNICEEISNIREDKKVHFNQAGSIEVPEKCLRA
jgi:hypothetical protein